MSPLINELNIHEDWKSHTATVSESVEQWNITDDVALGLLAFGRRFNSTCGNALSLSVGTMLISTRRMEIMSNHVSANSNGNRV